MYMKFTGILVVFLFSVASFSQTSNDMCVATALSKNSLLKASDLVDACKNFPRTSVYTAAAITDKFKEVPLSTALKLSFENAQKVTQCTYRLSKETDFSKAFAECKKKWESNGLLNFEIESVVEVTHQKQKDGSKKQSSQ